ncbi:hypothetical protein [Alteromonas sp.]|jgi:hypothetical protein|uniref:hypothetical protein n=1 Tax=Alteromonas sp. TaxID=232 RepID=UPI000E805836|nr:hypothetical protein [Alteromonas macleodii]|tara:strand:+ start:10121 stop:10597 length:477 start_codon:yes stop_codon:yes gene_type:complete
MVFVTSNLNEANMLVNKTTERFCTNLIRNKTDNAEDLSQTDTRPLRQGSAPVGGEKFTPPEYLKIVNEFDGTMKDWYQLVLDTHIEYGYEFEYIDFEEALLKAIKQKFPNLQANLHDSSLNNDKIIEILREHCSDELVEMFAVCAKQNDDYWSGELEA